MNPAAEVTNRAMDMVINLEQSHDLAKESVISLASKLQAAEARLRESEALVERLQAFVDEIKGIADISDGVSGFHQNGELLNWRQVDCMVGAEDLLALTPGDALAGLRDEMLEELIKQAKPHSMACPNTFVVEVKQIRKMKEPRQ